MRGLLGSLDWWEFSLPSSNLGGRSWAFSSSDLLRWSPAPSVLNVPMLDILDGWMGARCWVEFAGCYLKLRRDLMRRCL